MIKRHEALYNKVICFLLQYIIVKINQTTNYLFVCIVSIPKELI